LLDFLNSFCFQPDQRRSLRAPATTDILYRACRGALVRLSYSAKSAAIQQCFSLTINQRTVLSTIINQQNEQAIVELDCTVPHFASLFNLIDTHRQSKYTKNFAVIAAGRIYGNLRYPSSLTARLQLDATLTVTLVLMTTLRGVGD
jgi:hypothetical protein